MHLADPLREPFVPSRREADLRETWVRARLKARRKALRAIEQFFGDGRADAVISKAFGIPTNYIGNLRPATTAEPKR